MSKEAYAREALGNARIDESRIAEIEALLAATPADERQNIDAFLNATIEGATTMNEFRGIDQRPIRSGFEHRLGGGPAAIETWTRCITELQQLGIKPLEAVAVAVARAVELAPDAFGALTRWPSENEPPRLPQLLKVLPELVRKAGAVALGSEIDTNLALWRAHWAWKGADTSILFATSLESATAFIEWLSHQ